MAYGSLTPSQIGELVRGFGSPHEAALEAIEDPRYKRVFDEIGGVRVVEQNGRLYAVPSSPTSEARFWDLVYAWAEGKLRDAEPKGDEGIEASATLVSERHPYPEPRPTLYVRTTIQAALRRLEGKRTRANKLPPKDTIRTKKMWSKGLLGLDEDGHLVVDERVLQTRGLKIGLRVWDERQGRWLDPYSAM